MSTRTARNSKLATRRRTGATAVEFAIVAPIFFTLVIASLEFGRLNIIRHTADQAAYEAARFAMVPGATAAEAKSKAESMLKVVGARDSKITIVGPTDDKVTVTVDVPLNKNGWIAPKFTKNKTIHATSTLKTERPID